MMKKKTPVLLVTHDDVLWQHWKTLSEEGQPESDRFWVLERGHDLSEIARWRQRGHALVILDADLPGRQPWTDVAIWRELMRDLTVLVASMRPNDDEGRQVLAAGAGGYAHAYVPPQALNSILGTIAGGDIWVGRSLLNRLLQDIDSRLPPEGQEGWARDLTAREQEVARRAATGQSNQAIAEALEITERTVRAHLSAVFEKLGVTDRLMLALKVHGIR